MYNGDYDEGGYWWNEYVYEYMREYECSENEAHEAAWWARRERLRCAGLDEYI